MPRTTINPADDFDTQLRAAHRRSDLLAPTDDESEPAPAGPKAATPAPLPGGAATPHYAPAVPSGDALLRAAIAAARGESIPHHLRPFVSVTGTSSVVTGVD